MGRKLTIWSCDFKIMLFPDQMPLGTTQKIQNFYRCFHIQHDGNCRWPIINRVIADDKAGNTIAHEWCDQCKQHLFIVIVNKKLDKK